MNKFKKIALTVGSGIISIGYMFVWTMIFCFTGVLMLVDWIHWIWTNRRISWIKTVMTGWSDLFDHPFTKA